MPKRIWEKSYGAGGGFAYHPSEELNRALRPENENQFLQLLNEIDVDKEKDRLLIEAVERGNDRVVAILLERNADPNTALHTAAHRANKKIFSMLLKADGADPNFRDFQNETILMKQARYEIRFNKDIFNLLIAKKANLDEKNSYHETALDTAIDSCNFHMISILLNHGATIDRPSIFFDWIQEFDQREPFVLTILQEFCNHLKKDPTIKNTTSETYQVLNKASNYLEKLQRLTEICNEKGTPLASFIDNSFIPIVIRFFEGDRKGRDYLTPLKVDALLKRFSGDQHTKTIEPKEKLTTYKMS